MDSVIPNEKATVVEYAMNTTGMSEQEIADAHARFQAEDAPIEEKPQAPESSIDVNALTSKYSKLSFADIEQMIRLHQDGRTQVEIAALLGCSQPTVSATLKKLSDTPEVVQALMKGKSFEVLQSWKTATRVAAKRGDHRPSREWIEAAYPELRPQQGNNSGGGGITVNIGMPGAPIALPVIELQPVSAATFAPVNPTLTPDLHRLTEAPTSHKDSSVNLQEP